MELPGSMVQFLMPNWNHRRKDKETRAGKILKEVMAQNFQNLVKDINLQIQESQQIPNNKLREKYTLVYPSQTSENHQ